MASKHKQNGTYRTARAQKNGYEAAIIACKQYAKENSRYPNAEQLIKWCSLQKPKIEGVHHRFAKIIIPILNYPEHKFIDYSINHLCQFIYDHTAKEECNHLIDKDHAVLKIQKCIHDLKIDGKKFHKMTKDKWTNALNDYYISNEVATTYYEMISKHEDEKNKKEQANDDQSDDYKNEDEDMTELSLTMDTTPHPDDSVNSITAMTEMTESQISKLSTAYHPNPPLTLKRSISPYEVQAQHLKEFLLINQLNEGDEPSISINSLAEQEMEALREEIASLKMELEKRNNSKEQIEKLNLTQLNELEIKLLNDLKVVRERKEKLIQNSLFCILCLKNSKNVIINQCSHFVLCSECEKDLEPKICPKCKTKFKKITIVNV